MARNYESYFRTRDSWNKMNARFVQEWNDAFDVFFKRKQYTTADMVLKYFFAQGERIQRERWPESNN